MCNIILCEPYYAGSHRAWADGLAAHSEHRVHLAVHNGGFWKWRMQGAALTLAAEVRHLVRDHGRPDALLVSDMVNLAALLGFVRAELADVPVALYLHENQLTYPLPREAGRDHTYAMANWLSMAVADRVVFNSEYHRREVLDALPRFLHQFPDHRHSEALEAVAARSEVLPVGIDHPDPRAGEAVTADPDPKAPPIVLWNHRWEYDKDPEAFFAALEDLAGQGIPFRLAVAGESFQTVPEAFARARERFADRIVHFGTASPGEYSRLLRQADIVVSTARHEFFGVAVVEAMAAGAFPILPDRLSYPELLPDPAEPYLYRDHHQLVDRLRWALTEPAGRRSQADRTRAHTRRFDWREVAPRYDALFSALTPACGLWRSRAG